jgi:hypothetical protein
MYLRNLSLLLVGCCGLATPGWGHQVKTNEAVGATIHFEPSDRPQAQIPTQVWFALTKRGGRVIPLQNCRCQLQVRSVSAASTAQRVALVAINAENYRDIPSATVTFPKAGIYALELRGQPLQTGDFQPFRLYFETTVVAGLSSSPAVSLASAPRVVPKSQQQFKYPINFFVLLGLIASLFAGFWWLRRFKS